MKKILSVILLTGLICNGYAQRILSLDSCRTLALANNKELRIAKEKSMPLTISKRRLLPTISPR